LAFLYSNPIIFGTTVQSSNYLTPGLLRRNAQTGSFPAASHGYARKEKMPPVKLNASIANVDELPDAAVITKRQASALTSLSADTLNRDPEIKTARVQLSERRFGYRLGVLREVLRQRTGNGA
jgi:hypothetical protein